MRIAVVGGGPAGLYFATLWKKRHPDAQVDVAMVDEPCRQLEAVDGEFECQMQSLDAARGVCRLVPVI